MFTSVTKKRILWLCVIYVCVSIFLYLFAKIYTHFSFGETSEYMNNMYLIILIGGFINFLLQLVLARYNHYFKVANNLYNSGLALIVSGMLIKGIINISGRYTDAHKIYIYAGVIFLCISILTLIGSLIRLQIKKPTI